MCVQECARVHMCVYVCVRKRERGETEREAGRQARMHTHARASQARTLEQEPARDRGGREGEIK